jgi:hypothetical protein
MTIFGRRTVTLGENVLHGNARCSTDCLNPPEWKCRTSVVHNMCLISTQYKKRKYVHVGHTF